MDDDLRKRYADALHDRVSTSAWPKGWGVPSPPTSHELADAVMAVRDTELERVSGYAERMAEMVIEKDREATQWAERLHKVEAAIARVHKVHRIHWCEVDGHKLDRTPNPCVNNGICRCGQRNPCPTLAALDSPKDTTS